MPLGRSRRHILDTPDAPISTTWFWPSPHVRRLALPKLRPHACPSRPSATTLSSSWPDREKNRAAGLDGVASCPGCRQACRTPGKPRNHRTQDRYRLRTVRRVLVVRAKRISALRNSYMRPALRGAQPRLRARASDGARRQAQVIGRIALAMSISSIRRPRSDAAGHAAVRPCRSRTRPPATPARRQKPQPLRAIRS
jgi:hypothetical protein